MNSAAWLSHFQQNLLNRPKPNWQKIPRDPFPQAALLARSLSHFQLGESGEGRFLLTEARQSFPDDPDYCAALELFIQEEQEHARLLAMAVRRLGGQPIARHWSHFLFRQFRRALGVHFEIQVLVIAELVGTAYYRLLQQRCPDPVLVELCALVLRDEAFHIAFHAERFTTTHAAWLPLERAIWAAQFQALFLAAMAVVWVDHGAALRALGSSRGEFVRLARDECVRFLARLPVSGLEKVNGSVLAAGH